jgi:hypothetical protein
MRRRHLRAESATIDQQHRISRCEVATARQQEQVRPFWGLLQLKSGNALGALAVNAIV